MAYKDCEKEPLGVVDRTSDTEHRSRIKMAVVNGSLICFQAAFEVLWLGVAHGRNLPLLCCKDPCFTSFHARFFQTIFTGFYNHKIPETANGSSSLAAPSADKGADDTI